TLHLALAPKSNRSAAALWKAQADVRERPAGRVPAHLRSAHPWQKRVTEDGTGYVYPHDDPRGWVPQQYRPDGVAGRTYYEPSAHGDEAGLAEWVRTRSPEEPGAGAR
ncbi:MAG: replication-associated recombination protein A, partial [Actinomycetota bacterium]|nr:replication-associated recombination protein A [Actinomycetota bacterium]